MKFFAVLALISAVAVDKATPDNMVDVDLNDVMDKMSPDQMETMLNNEAAQLPADEAEAEEPENDDDLVEDETPDLDEDEEAETPE